MKLHQALFALLGLAVLAGCGDPMGGVARLSDVAPATQNDAVQAALLEADKPAQPLFGGLFAGFGQGGGAEKAAPAEKRPARTGPDAQQVKPGDKVPFGQIATACGVKKRDMGQKLGKTGGFTLWDTAPGSTAQRAHYVTGFRDGCPRQFTAALAMFGDPLAHEKTRYKSVKSSYSNVDQGYEAIKAKVCRVSHGKPCGANMTRLTRNTAIISAYEVFGSTVTWSDILLHDKGVVAMDRH